MAKSTVNCGATNNPLPYEPQEYVNEEGNPVHVLVQEPLEVTEADEPVGDTETAEQDPGATGVQDTVPEPPEVPQEPVEDDAAKAVRLQSELDALKGGS